MCGLGVPSLRSPWGAIRNRQLYVLQKTHFSGKKFFACTLKKKMHDLAALPQLSRLFYAGSTLGTFWAVAPVVMARRPQGFLQPVLPWAC